MRDPLDKHAPVAGDLEAKERRRLVQQNQVHAATGDTAQGDLQQGTRMLAVVEENADIEVARRAASVSPRRAEEHSEANPSRFEPLA